MRYALEVVLVLVITLTLAGKTAMDVKPVHLDHRREDFTILAEALERYRQDHGQYPESTGWDGFRAPWGKASPDWIPGLVPDYVPYLPHDPRDEDSPSRQYFYKSDGRDYKLIAHHVEDCEQARGDPVIKVDPARDCFAYGIWTKNSENW